MSWNTAYDNEDRGGGFSRTTDEIAEIEMFMRKMYAAQDVVKRRKREDEMIAFFNQNALDQRWLRVVNGGTLT